MNKYIKKGKKYYNLNNCFELEFYTVESSKVHVILYNAGDSGTQSCEVITNSIDDFQNSFEEFLCDEMAIVFDVDSYDR